MRDWLKRHGRQLPAVLGIVLFCGAVYVVQHQFRSLRITDIRHAMEQIPRHALLVSFAFTVAAYGILTFYDRLGTIYAGHPVSHLRAAFASFCAYALSHNLGFAAVSGAAVRYRLYANWGLTPVQIGKVIAFCSLTFGLGGMLLGTAILWGEPRAVPFFGDRLPLWALHLIGFAMFALVAAYMALSRFMPVIRVRGREIELPHWRMAIAQVLLAAIDVAVTAGILYALLPSAPGLTYVRFLAVYLGSYTAGLVASLPGGLGVFDTAMLFGLSPYLKPPEILGAVLVFRLYYYIIPLFLAGGLFAGNEMLLRGRGLFKRSAPTPVRSRWSEPDFAVAAGAGAVALCGFMLLSLGIIEGPSDFSWIDPDLAAVAATAGEFVPSLMGAALLVLAAALSRRVNLAWGATILLLLLAAMFTAAQNEPYWIPGVLVLAGLLIAPYRSAFYRHARLFTGPVEASVALPLMTFVLCVLALAVFERRLRWLDDDSFWQVIVSPDVPQSLRVSVALAVTVALVALWRMLRPGRVTSLAWSSEARRSYAALGAIPPASADGFIWGEAERAGIPFRRIGRVLLALGDPAGADADRVSAVWRLRDLAQQEGRDPAIWGAGRAMLGVYADLGLTAVPLGRDGMPMLEQRAISAIPANDMLPVFEAQRFLVCVAERDLPALMPVLPELARHAGNREAA